MNYYKQFAEMLGLELGEEFNLICTEEETDENTYKITEDGMYYQGIQHDSWWGEPYKTLDSLLMGEVKAVPKPWKPSEGYTYWWYSIAWKQAIDNEFNSSIGDLLHWKVGNCFKTKEEAETKGKEIMEKLVKEYEEA